MAKESARRSLAPAAAIGRARRGRPAASKLPLTMTVKSISIPKKRGRPPGAKSGNGKSPVAGRGITKKGRRRQSAATKARKLKEAAKSRKSKGVVKDARDEEPEPVNAPEPVKVFHEELKTSGLEWETEAIIDSKIEEGERYYLVKWVGYPHSYNTWEPEVNIYNSGELLKAFDDLNPPKP